MVSKKNGNGSGNDRGDYSQLFGKQEVGRKPASEKCRITVPSGSSVTPSTITHKSLVVRLPLLNRFARLSFSGTCFACLGKPGSIVAVERQAVSWSIQATPLLRLAFYGLSRLPNPPSEPARLSA